jgi:hypothetical protein
MILSKKLKKYDSLINLIFNIKVIEAKFHLLRDVSKVASDEKLLDEQQLAAGLVAEVQQSKKEEREMKEAEKEQRRLAELAAGRQGGMPQAQRRRRHYY